MSAATPVLATSRFTCRPLQEGDEDALWPAFSDPQAMRYWSRAPFTDKAAFRDYLFDDSWGGRTWLAEPIAGGTPVFRMVASEPSAQVAEIGYIMVPGHTGMGIARECLAALLGHLFAQENFHRVFADVDPRNAASCRVLEKLGFTREAHLRHAMKTHIGWCDTALWGLLADEWIAPPR